MLTVYVLSFSHLHVVDNETVHVYEWVKVGYNQVTHGMDHLPTLPELTPGNVITFKVDSNKEQTLRIMGDKKLRQLGKKEQENLVKNNAPVIRLG